MKLVKSLRREEYDAALLFHRASSLGAFVTACRIPVRIGIDLEGDGYWMTHPVVEDAVKHETLVYGSLLKPLGLELDDYRMEIFASDEDKDRADRLWKTELGSENGIVIGIIPGGGVNPGQAMPQKIWLGYRELTEALLAKGYRVAYFGGESDLSHLENLPQGKRVVSFIGAGSLGLSSELMKRCDLVVTHDSGPMHLAAAAGVKVLSIFAPTDPIRYAPLGEDNRFLQPEIECAPCYHRGRWREDCERDCIGIVTVERVIAEVDSVLSKSK